MGADLTAAGATVASALAALTLSGLACRDDQAERAAGAATGGDVERGRAVIAAHDCGVCHTIPGISGARGVVGPPLSKFAHRAFVAGVLPNTPTNVVRWILDPPVIDPDTAMPSLGLREQEARDAAAYLYVLR